MKDTPRTDTPRTDEWLAEEKRNPRLSGLGKWLDYCKQLERELTAARAEIAELNEEYGTWWAQKSIALDELKEVTEQRDRLAEALTKIARGEPNWADCVVLAREALQSLNQPERTI